MADKMKAIIFGARHQPRPNIGGQLELDCPREGYDVAAVVTSKQISFGSTCPR